MSICLCEAPMRECARVSACALCACVCVWREERGTKGKRGVLSTTNVKQFPAFFCISDTATNREQETRQNRGVEQFKSIGERIWFLVEKKKEENLKNGGMEQFKVYWCYSSKSIGVFFLFQKKRNLKNGGMEQFKVYWCADFSCKQMSNSSRSLRIHIYV